jgi:hypothetical protein
VIVIVTEVVVVLEAEVIENSAEYQRDQQEQETKCSNG